MRKQNKVCRLNRQLVSVKWLSRWLGMPEMLSFKSIKLGPVVL